MPYSPEQLDELTILTLYNLATSQEGIKVHSQTAAPGTIAATQRLYRRGFVTQSDGGYLTDLGRKAAEHAQALLTLFIADKD